MHLLLCLLPLAFRLHWPLRIFLSSLSNKTTRAKSGATFGSNAQLCSRQLPGRSMTRAQTTARAQKGQQSKWGRCCPFIKPPPPTTRTTTTAITIPAPLCVFVRARLNVPAIGQLRLRARLCASPPFSWSRFRSSPPNAPETPTAQPASASLPVPLAACFRFEV